MEAPSVTSFGAETPDDAVPVTLVSAPETLRDGDGESRCRPSGREEVITIAALPEVDLLPAPARGQFPLQPHHPQPRQEGQAQAEPGDHPLGEHGHHRLGPRQLQQRADGRQSRQARHQARRSSADRPASKGPAGHRSRSPGRRQASRRHTAVECTTSRNPGLAAGSQAECQIRTPLARICSWSGLDSRKSPANWARMPESAASASYSSIRSGMVRPRGLEPPRVAPLAPQASASTNSATAADEVKRAPMGAASKTAPM